MANTYTQIHIQAVFAVSIATNITSLTGRGTSRECRGANQASRLGDGLLAVDLPGEEKQSGEPGQQDEA